MAWPFGLGVDKHMDGGVTEVVEGGLAVETVAATVEFLMDSSTLGGSPLHSFWTVKGNAETFKSPATISPAITPITSPLQSVTRTKGPWSLIASRSSRRHSGFISTVVNAKVAWLARSVPWVYHDVKLNRQ